MDSISRSALLSLLRSQTMSQEDIIKLVEGMQPLEVDSKAPNMVVDATSWGPLTVDYTSLGVSPDLLGWPAGIVSGLG